MENQNIFSEAFITYGSIDDSRALTLIKAVKEGIQYSFFSYLAEKTPFSFTEWANFLHLSDRTMQRYKKEKKAFDQVYAERIIEVIMLYNYGIEVFEQEEKFHDWLDTSNIALGGVTPRSMLDSTIGIAMLKDELMRIEQGVLA